jgi:hypothetical protein
MLTHQGVQAPGPIVRRQTMGAERSCLAFLKSMQRVGRAVQRSCPAVAGRRGDHGVFLTAGCARSLNGSTARLPPQQGDYASDFDYCDQLARATLHAEGEISSDIGHELETDHATRAGHFGTQCGIV